MRWSEAPLPPDNVDVAAMMGGVGEGGGGDGGGGSIILSSSHMPQIKNHSVTHHRGYLYCYGGYDGRRNHQTLSVYSLRERRWMNADSTAAGGGGGGGVDEDLDQDFHDTDEIRRRGMANGGGGHRLNVRGVPPPGRNGHTATLAIRGGRRRWIRRRRGRNGVIDNDNDSICTSSHPPSTIKQQQPDDEHDRNDTGNHNVETNAATPAQGIIGDGDENHSEQTVDHALLELAQSMNAMDADLDGGSIEMSSLIDSSTACIDDGRNPNEDDELPIANNNDDNVDDYTDDELDIDEMDDEIENNNNMDDEEDAQIIIIGGWLGQGPFASSDCWVLDISGGLDRMRWFQPPTRGTPPGPCNMHSADFISSRGEVYVFRGGNGREYLNDLHALDVDTYTWRVVRTHGTPPQRRANHSSALLDDGIRHGGKSELFVFGGWNGSERLNDVHILDTHTSTWSTPRVFGVKPHPRAGMTLTALRGRLYLFGGSGTASKCFADLQVLDRVEMAWLDVNEGGDNATVTRMSSSNNSGGGGGARRPPPPPSFGESSSYYDNSWEMIGDTGGGNNLMDSAASAWDMLGGQDGAIETSMTTGGRGRDNLDNNGGNSDGIRFADYRSYARSSRGTGGPICSSANPNDEDTVPSVYVSGKPPGRRAGHTSTAVGRHIYVFGGSCGTDYLNDFFVLDTDPPPPMKITEPPSSQLFANRLRHFYNDDEFSDVTFLVEGRKVFGHKLVLSTVSDCFRAMFMTGFRESGSEKTEIEIPNCTHRSFVTMMEYIYTGRCPRDIDVFHGDGMDRAIALLELADQFFLYNLKQIIEGVLQPAVNGETYAFLCQVAQKTNANQLESYCRFFERNMNELIVE